MERPGEGVFGTCGVEADCVSGFGLAEFGEGPVEGNRHAVEWLTGGDGFEGEAWDCGDGGHGGGDESREGNEGFHHFGGFNLRY